MSAMGTKQNSGICVMSVLGQLQMRDPVSPIRRSLGTKMTIKVLLWPLSFCLSFYN